MSQSTTGKGLREALRLASQDAQFAQKLMHSPESVKTEYNLSDDAINEIRRSSRVAKTASELNLRAASDEPDGYESGEPENQYREGLEPEPAF